MLNLTRCKYICKMKVFVTGIGTNVGKTIVSAIITEALQADYWKPVQAGDIDNSDSIKIRGYISNDKSRIFPEAYVLNTPASPHISAELDGITITLEKIKEPVTKNHLVIEGAGGILVPLNSTDIIADIIMPDYKVVIISRHYLGSINHTLLTVEVLRQRNISIAGIVFNGGRVAATEDIIIKKAGLTMLGRIDDEPYFDKSVVLDYAAQFRDRLLLLEKQ